MTTIDRDWHSAATRPRLEAATVIRFTGWTMLTVGVLLLGFIV